jgi:hypothetical protein
VLAIRGPCFLTAGGQRAALGPGASVSVGDVVEVGEAARLKLRMIDGSIIAAASGTKGTIQAYGTDAAGHRDVGLQLADGLLRAVVAHVAQPSRFEVRTATGVAAVRSTDWFVRSSSAGTQVGVLKGRVALASVATGAQVVIPARWGARVLAGRDPVPPRLWTHAEFADVIERTDIP